MNPDEFTTQQLRDILLERGSADGRELQAKHIEPLLRAMLEKTPPRTGVLRRPSAYQVDEFPPTTYIIDVDGMQYFVGISVQMMLPRPPEPEPDPVTTLLGRRKKV